jgi:ADP-heptose:LPS heptosyltransferase
MFHFKKTYKLPFRYEIPQYIEIFLKQGGLLKRWIKYLKRYLFITIKRQRSLELFSISPKHQNILWINVSAPSFGDSLMDLSSRVLLEGKKIDLFTTKKMADIFTNDNRFNNVYSTKDLVPKNNYNLVIVDSFSTRSIKLKCKIAPKANFIGMYGYFNGPEVNRVLFSFHQMNNHLGYYKSEKEINSYAKTSIYISDNDQAIINKANLPNNFIAIVLGGEWSYRSYKKWDKVVKYILRKDSNLNIVLVGSDNGSEIAKKITLEFKDNNVFNYVARYSFNQTSQIISQAHILFCCDGGLMHAANALNKTIIPLFARLTPEMQLTDCAKAFPLFDYQNVNNIKAEDVVERYYEAINF